MRYDVVVAMALCMYMCRLSHKLCRSSSNETSWRADKAAGVVMEDHTRPRYWRFLEQVGIMHDCVYYALLQQQIMPRR